MARCPAERISSSLPGSDFRFGSLADIRRDPGCPLYPTNGHTRRLHQCPLSATNELGSFRATSESADYDCKSRSISPEIKVELARLVPCGVTHHKIARNRKIKRQTKHAVAQGDFRHR